MAKDKLQKRKEALARQLESLCRHIKSWCEYMSWDKDRYHDNETTAVYETALVSSAHAARCDRHGNYLDYRFYKNDPIGSNGKQHLIDPYEYALHCKLYSLEEMKQIKADSNETLYRIAYGDLNYIPWKEQRNEKDAAGRAVNDLVLDLCKLSRLQQNR